MMSFNVLVNCAKQAVRVECVYVPYNLSVLESLRQIHYNLDF